MTVADVIQVKRALKARKVPSAATLERWVLEGGCKATDGCWVEHDGQCEHGCNSWFIELGLI